MFEREARKSALDLLYGFLVQDGGNVRGFAGYPHLGEFMPIAVCKLHSLLQAYAVERKDIGVTSTFVKVAVVRRFPLLDAFFVQLAIPGRHETRVFEFIFFRLLCRSAGIIARSGF